MHLVDTAAEESSSISLFLHSGDCSATHWALRWAALGTWFVWKLNETSKDRLSQIQLPDLHLYYTCIWDTRGPLFFWWWCWVTTAQGVCWSPCLWSRVSRMKFHVLYFLDGKKPCSIVRALSLGRSDTEGWHQASWCLLQHRVSLMDRWMHVRCSVISIFWQICSSASLSLLLEGSSQPLCPSYANRNKWGNVNAQLSLLWKSNVLVYFGKDTYGRKLLGYL